MHHPSTIIIITTMRAINNEQYRDTEKTQNEDKQTKKHIEN
jgi:hypothetical protein